MVDENWMPNWPFEILEQELGDTSYFVFGGGGSLCKFHTHTYATTVKRFLFSHVFFHTFLRPAIHLSQNMRKWARNAKNEKCITGCFASLFCVSRPFFAVRISHHGWHSREKSKNFVVDFFAAVMKHVIRVNCEKCIVSVSYFVVCFGKNTRKM